MPTLAQDIRLGLRVLARAPVTAGVAIIVVALGIGVVTTTFSAVSSLVLHPLPFPSIEEIVLLKSVDLGNEGRSRPVSPADYSDWRTMSDSFGEVAAFRSVPAVLNASGYPEDLYAYGVSPEFFDVLDMDPLQGRTFIAGAAALEPDELVLSHAFWQRQLGGTDGALHSRLLINDREMTVVGIMPPEFDYPLGTDLWTPLTLSPAETTERSVRSLRVIARLGPSSSVQRARSDMTRIGQTLARDYPDTNRDYSVRVVPLLEDTNFGTRRFVLYLLGTALFLLSLVCVNVANLQLVRATGRQREFAIRIAHGAGRWHIARQLLTESLLLSIAGGVLGVILGAWGVSISHANVPPQISRFIVTGLGQMSVNGEVLLLVAIAVVLTGVLSGIVPAMRLSAPRVSEALKEGGRGVVGGLGSLQRMLLVAEFALSMLLLVGAGTMVQGFREMAGARHGFDPASLLTFGVSLPDDAYPGEQEVGSFYREAENTLRSIEGAVGVTVTSSRPTVGSLASADMAVEGGWTGVFDNPPTADLVVAGSDYFATMDIPVLDGRGFDARDRVDGAPVTVLSRRAAEVYFPESNPLGRRIRLSAAGFTDQWLTVIGIAGDVSSDWLEEDIQPTAYLAQEQIPRRSMFVMVRTAGDPYELLPAVRTRMARIAPSLPLREARSMDDILFDMRSGIRLAAGQMAVMALIALVLSTAGLFAIMGHSVSTRRREIGIRMAVGATSRDVFRLYVGRGVRYALLGLAIGVPAAIAMTETLSSYVLGVLATNPVTLLLLSLLLLVTGSVASLPARRASSVDPVSAMRME
jgi:predicted permease